MQTATSTNVPPTSGQRPSSDVRRDSDWSASASCVPIRRRRCSHLSTISSQTTHPEKVSALVIKMQVVGLVLDERFQNPLLTVQQPPSRCSAHAGPSG